MDGFAGLDARPEGASFGRANPIENAVVTGWFVADIDEKASGLVTAFIDGEPSGQATIQAVTSYPESVPSQAHGFSYSIPRRYQDGLSHVLSLILFNGSAIEFPTRTGLTRSNLRFRFEEPAPPLSSHSSGPTHQDAASVNLNSSTYAGLADPFSDTTITGWAVSRQTPMIPTSLRMFIDGHPAGIATCTTIHAGLRAMGFPVDTGGFAYTIPDRFLDGATHSLSILFEDGATLFFRGDEDVPQAKIEFTAEPITSIEGIVDGQHGDLIKGWAIRKHHRTGDYEGNVQLQVLCNGIVISEIVADQPRMDVAREHRCDPRVGFAFKLPPQCQSGLEFEFVFRTLPEGDTLPGCPLTIKHRSTENEDDLKILSDTVGDLCTRVFKLQRHVRGMMPLAEATVSIYDAWARRNLQKMRTRIIAEPPLADDSPLVSIVMPTYQTNLAYLTAAIESVLAQTYQNWELIIIDDGSNQSALKACLKQYAAANARITYRANRINRGISAATNDAFRRARGTYIVLFDHDDLMVDFAIEALLREALRTGAKLLYSDEDKIDDLGLLSEPHLKPDWNYRLLLSINYICHLVMINRELLNKVGSLRAECNGAQDHDLMLRIAERCLPGQIVHLPQILYHWRKSSSSTAEATEAKPYAIEAGRLAIAQHLSRGGFSKARVSAVGNTTSYSVSWGFTNQPSVTIIIPFKDQIPTTSRCLECLLANTDWENWTVVLVDNGSVTPEAGAFCRQAILNPHVKVRRLDEAFNYSRINNIAVREHPADYLVFLNNDVFIEQADWLRIMIDETLADPRVAIVGAKLLYPNRTVQHAGVVLGVGGVADHVFRGIPADHGGYMNRARCAQHYSAVTAACMLCRADVFDEIGGFDEHDLTVAFNDVDLCLKAGKKGWHIVWTPDHVAEHHESLSRGDDISPAKAPRFFYENHIMLERWHAILPEDPNYNPNFSRNQGLFTDLV